MLYQIFFDLQLFIGDLSGKLDIFTLPFLILPRLRSVGGSNFVPDFFRNGQAVLAGCSSILQFGSEVFQAVVQAIFGDLFLQFGNAVINLDLLLTAAFRQRQLSLPEVDLCLFGQFMKSILFVFELLEFLFPLLHHASTATAVGGSAGRRPVIRFGGFGGNGLYRICIIKFPQVCYSCVHWRQRYCKILADRVADFGCFSCQTVAKGNDLVKKRLRPIGNEFFHDPSHRRHHFPQSFTER